MLATLLLLSGPVFAFDAVAGKTLYNTSVGPGGSTCSSSNCHGTNPAGGANKIRNGANNSSAIQRGIANDSGGMSAYSGKLTVTDLSNIAAFIGVTAAVAPATLTFPSTTVGSTSNGQTVTVTSQGVSALTINSVSSSSADFVVATTGSCKSGTSVAGYNTSTAKYSACSVVVTFAPQASGTRTGTLTIGTSDPALPTATVSLTGPGAAGAQPIAGIAPGALSFGSATAGAQSTTQTVTLSNTGAAALNLSSIGTNSADFSVSGGSCAVGTPVPATSGSCTVLLKFTPQTAGAKSGTLSIAHNAANSPSTVALSGTGTAATPVAQLAPTALSFSQNLGSTSPAQSVTLSNTGSAPLLLSTVRIGGANASDYVIATGTTCVNGSSVAAGASCVVKIAFTPGASGARPAALSIVHNDAAHSPSSASLNGTGTTVASGQVALNKTSMAFAAQPQYTRSAAQAVTVSNSGSAALTLSAISLGGANAVDYAIESAGTSCNTATAIPVGGSCSIAISFTPSTASGSRVATLTVASSSSGSSASMSISGVAAPPAVPLVALAPTSMSFGTYGIGAASPTQTATLTNNGNAALAISGISVTPADYQLTHNCPATLAAGASCALQVTFTPRATGAINGAVSVLSNATTSPDSLALSGSGANSAGALLNWAAGTGAVFPDTTIFGSAPSQTLTMINQGGAAATIQQVQIAGANATDFSLDPSTTCIPGASVPVGGNCAVILIFTPSGGGARAATLSVISNASGPAPATLSGNGVANGTPVLTLSTTFVNLAGAPNGGLQSQIVGLQNDGGGVLTITSIQAPASVMVLNASSSGGGSCPAASFSLQPGTSCTLVIAPVAASPFNATVQVLSNASPKSASVTVSGVAISNVGSASGGAMSTVWVLLCIALVAVPIRRYRKR